MSTTPIAMPTPTAMRSPLSRRERRPGSSSRGRSCVLVLEAAEREEFRRRARIAKVLW
ncbi:uncharacterized protein VDAG_05401 [Verticillium dahliae VdLs.17]|uniref:Uncharacterized protein n=1 Tax=Verticillium dahliae (strain VdLs.17 / ATCC MYA-4575 / FGSC 10137) TaxID=498257 RepID=G2X596_VERDV|nr:uncharacterized protein VDAG_05401 [Verticillium dahliae VdLs.17]EGY14237.1 hypothetical protein VDAG_05401 [Verticillium dahliae VdLs.17]